MTRLCAAALSSALLLARSQLSLARFSAPVSGRVSAAQSGSPDRSPGSSISTQPRC